MREVTTYVKLSTAIVTAAVVMACGGSKSPVAPTNGAPSINTAPAPPSSGIVTGASIDGTVVGVSGGLAFGARPMGAGTTVSVMGTSVSSPVDASGHFLLRGVPSGDVQLQVSGGGVNATLMLTGVSEREEIHITIQVSGSSASADDTTRETSDNRAEVEGKITAIAGNVLTVAGKNVTIPTGTPIRHGSTSVLLSDLHVGDRVHVHGTVNGSSITATEVELQTSNPGNPGSPVPTPGDDHGNDPGDDHGNNPGDDHGNAPGDDHGQGEAELAGAIAAKGGTCPSITFTIGTTKVATDGKTTFKDTSCSSLANGNQVEVKGTRQSNGSVLASRIQKR